MATQTYTMGGQTYTTTGSVPVGGTKVSDSSGYNVPGTSIVNTNQNNGGYTSTSYTGSSPINTQSTTTISSNKTPDILNTQNALNNINRGITSDPNSGVVTYSNGSAVNTANTQNGGNQATPTVSTTTDANGFQSYDSTGYSQANDILNKMLEQTDADTVNALQSVQNKYARLKAQQEKVNESQKAAAIGALFRSGAAQGDAYANNTIGYQDQIALNAIADLDSQEADALNAARAAGNQGRMRVMELQYQAAQDINKRKMDLIDKHNEKVQDRLDAAQANQEQAVRDQAITDLYSQGITDVPSILSSLKSLGYKDITSKDISETLKNTGIDDINKIAQEAAKNGAPMDVLAKIQGSKSAMEAIMNAGKYSSDPLDREYKRAQIAKIYDDLNNSGIKGMDASNLLAYANQYASTGQIPTGLPKGAFGVVAQAAKELPKNPGTIVDNNTGIRSSKLSATQEDAITSLYDLSKKIDSAKEMYNKSGVINRAEYNTLRNEIVDLLARARTGAAISASEEALYKSKIPNITWSIKSLGDIKLDGLKSSIDSKLDTNLQAQGLSIYGYSRINLGDGKQYTVGDTITLPNGASGRVNPDGTITTLN